MVEECENCNEMTVHDGILIYNNKVWRVNACDNPECEIVIRMELVAAKDR